MLQTQPKPRNKSQKTKNKIQKKVIRKKFLHRTRCVIVPRETNDKNKCVSVMNG